MANAGATSHKTLPPMSAESGLLQSNSHAVGSTLVSKRTVGVQVNNVCPWIARDVQNFDKCEADAMLQELLARCTGPSKSLSPSQKKTLFEASLRAVLPICNEGDVAQEIKSHVTEFCGVDKEPASYAPFVRAANCALLELREVNIDGIPMFKDDDKTNILLHVNDPVSIYQDHQDAQSEHKPDVVVVSHQTAVDHRKPEYGDFTETSCNVPKDDFRWTDIRSTLEFKRTHKHLRPPPPAYKTEYIVPAPSEMYMEHMHKASNEAVGTSSQQHARGIKRKRGGNNEDEDEEQEPNMIRAVSQNGSYIAEMFAAHIAHQHVISFLINNDYIYLWYCDRENTIQCAGINFVQDLPRLLLLLLIMQRMQYEQWGLNPVFEPEPGFSREVMVEDAQMQIDLKLDLKSNERVTHFGIHGRATTVFPVKSKALLGLRRNPHSQNDTSDLVAKLYWSEETRQSEVEILDEVYKIAQTDPDVLGHVPDLVWSHKFEGTSTSQIRIALGLKDAEQAKQGSRVLYILVFRKLLKITTLSGKEFLAAWWQIVKCHRALWKRGVCHRDISPNNLMGYRLFGQFIGVLNDYDLSLFQRDSPSGLKHTGTMPFMATGLLTIQAITGNVEHVYAHDAESFIWVLAWVCLRYEGGNLVSKNRPLQDWLKYDAIRCRKEKVDFWSVRLKTLRPTGSHEESWKVVKNGFQGIHSLYSPNGYLKLADQSAFELLLEKPMQEHLQGDSFLSGI